MVCHSLLQWTTFCQTSPPWPDHLGWPHTAWLSFIELDKAVVRVIRLVTFLWLWFQPVCPLMPSLSAYPFTWVSLTLEVGYLFTAAPAKHSHCFLPCTWSISAWPLLCCAVTALKHKLEARFLGEISVTSDMQITLPLVVHVCYMQITPLRYAESEEELKNLLMKVKEESEKVGLKLNIQKPKITASCPVTS